MLAPTMWRGRHEVSARRAVALILLGIAAALLGGVAPLFGMRSGANVARAAGIASTPTMLADSTPALLYPSAGAPANHPASMFGAPYVAGHLIHFSEDLSHVTNGYTPDGFKWRWSFGDGTGFVYDASPTHAFASAGTYDISSQLYDTDNNGWIAEDSAQIEIVTTAPPNPPVAKITASATAVALDTPVTYDAAGSHALVGSNLTYLWNFGDGATASGPRVVHTFTQTGSGIVALIVTDGRGTRSLATSDILIVPELPRARLTASYTTILPGADVTFDASHSTPPTNPSGDTLTTFNWNFGDGDSVSGPPPIVTHTFQSPGRYTVTVQAIDQQGAPGTASVVVNVVSQPTTAQANGGPSWPLLGAVAAVLILFAGAFTLRGQRKRAALIQQRQAAMELARARRVKPAHARGQLPQPSPRIIDATIQPNPRAGQLPPRPVQPTRPVHPKINMPPNPDGTPTPPHPGAHPERPYTPSQPPENDDWLR